MCDYICCFGNMAVIVICLRGNCFSLSCDAHFELKFMCSYGLLFLIVRSDWFVGEDCVYLGRR